MKNQELCDDKYLDDPRTKSHPEVEKTTYLTSHLLRTARKKTGMPQLPKHIKERLIELIGKDDYEWFTSEVEKAVSAKTEGEAIRITKGIEEQRKKHISSLPSLPESTPMYSVQHSGNAQEEMPDEPEEDEIEEAIDEEMNKEDGQGQKSEGEEKRDEKPSDKTKTDKTESEEEIEGDGEDERGSAEGGDYEEPSDEGGSDTGSNLESLTKELEEEIEQEIKQETEIINNNEVLGKFESYKTPDDKKEEEYYIDKGNKINTNSLEPIANRTAHLFKVISQYGNGWNHNQTRGRLEMHKLTSLYGSNQPKLFRKKTETNKTDIATVVLIDGSASMQDQGRSFAASKSAYILSRAMELCEYKMEIVVFGACCSNSVIGIKSFEQNLQFAKPRFVTYDSGYSTPLFEALQGAYKSLENIEAKRKLIFIVTDGRPDNPPACNSIMREIKSRGIEIMSVIINCPNARGIFPNSIIIRNDVEKIPEKLSEVIKNVLKTLR